MATRESTLWMRLVDGVTGPAGSVAGGLNRIGSAARGAGGQLSSSGFATGMKQLGAMALSYVTIQEAVRDVKAFAESERAMSRLGVATGWTREQMQMAHDTIESAAVATGQTTDKMETAMSVLVKNGRSMGEALGMLNDVGKVGTVFDVLPERVAKVNDALAAQMGLTRDQMPLAWASMAKAAKASNIAVGDFAENLSGSMADAGRSGYSGITGLQKYLSMAAVIAPQMDEGADAVKALGDAMVQMQSKAVVGAFKKGDIDIVDEMQKAKAAGKDTLEVFYNLSRNLTGGDFGLLKSMGVRNENLVAVLTALSKTKEADRQALFASIASADAGSINTGFDRYMGDTEAKLNALTIALEGLRRAAGSALVDMKVPEDVLVAIQAIETTIQNIRWAITQYQGTVKAYQDWAGFTPGLDKSKSESKMSPIDQATSAAADTTRSDEVRQRWQDILDQRKKEAGMVQTAPSMFQGPALDWMHAKGFPYMKPELMGPPTPAAPIAVTPTVAPAPSAGPAGASAGNDFITNFTAELNALPGKVAPIIDRIKAQFSNISVNINPVVGTPNMNAIKSDGANSPSRTGG